MKDELARLLLNWYRQNARSLPWRGHSDPYAIWVSEIMLQQTRVDTVLPYYLRWMRDFPDISTLANASEHAVLLAWEGLGYYNRARCMRRAAQQMMQLHDGKIPADYEQLLKLPGIGPYTAAAIASMAFGLDRAGMVTSSACWSICLTPCGEHPTAERCGTRPELLLEGNVMISQPGAGGLARLSACCVSPRTVVRFRPFAPSNRVPG